MFAMVTNLRVSIVLPSVYLKMGLDYVNAGETCKMLLNYDDVIIIGFEALHGEVSIFGLR